MRLDKYLADMSCGTRSDVKKLIRGGMVDVNKETVSKPEYQVNPESDRVFLKGSPVVYEKYVYYMMNKPAGVVSATEDNTCRTVLDVLTQDNDIAKVTDVFPVGRLDKDTEGLLLLTNDGELAHKLLAPRKHVDKTYYARISGCAADEDIKAFEEGIDIGDDNPTLSAQLKILSSGAESEVEVIIHEGRFHQIKRMFHARAMEVIFLKRLSMGSLVLDEALKPGECRRLTEEEVTALKRR